MRILLLALIATGAWGCSTLTPSERQAMTEIDRLEREVMKVKRERDQARADYEADILVAFRREQLDRKYPYAGMPPVPAWVSPVPLVAKEVTEEELEADFLEFCARTNCRGQK